MESTKSELRGWHSNYSDPVEEQRLVIKAPSIYRNAGWPHLLVKKSVDDSTYWFDIEHCHCVRGSSMRPDRSIKTDGFLTMDEAKSAALAAFEAMEQARRQAVDDALAQLKGE